MIERLCQEFDGALPHRSNPHPGIPMRSDKDDRNAAPVFFQFGLQLQARHLRHADVDDQTRSSSRPIAFKELLLMIAAALAAEASAQTAREVRGPSPLVAIENESPPRLIVDPPLPGPLAAGHAFIQYRTENLRVLPA